MQYAVLHTAHFNIKGQIYQTGKISIREKIQKSTDGRGQFCGQISACFKTCFFWVLNNSTKYQWIDERKSL